jgi:hypothetical protein
VGQNRFYRVRALGDAELVGCRQQQRIGLDDRFSLRGCSISASGSVP